MWPPNAIIQSLEKKQTAIIQSQKKLMIQNLQRVIIWDKKKETI